MSELKGRAAFLKAEEIVATVLARPVHFQPQVALPWAREQLRLQAVQHVRTMTVPTETFLNMVTSAIHAIDQVLTERFADRE